MERDEYVAQEKSVARVVVELGADGVCLPKRLLVVEDIAWLTCRNHLDVVVGDIVRRSSVFSLQSIPDAIGQKVDQLDV